MAYNQRPSRENDYEAAIWLTEGALVRAAALNALRACKVSEEAFAAVASATYAVLRTKQEAENAAKTPSENGGNPPEQLNVKV